MAESFQKGSNTFLTHSHTMTSFDTPPPGNKPFESTVGKVVIARDQQFLLFPQCFQKSFTGNTLKPGFVWERLISVNDPHQMTCNPFIGWLVVLGFNATLAAKVISWRMVTYMCFLAFSHQYYHNFSFQSHRLLFSHASAEVRGENSPERKVASNGDRTYNH